MNEEINSCDPILTYQREEPATVFSVLKCFLNISATLYFELVDIQATMQSGNFVLSC